MKNTRLTIQDWSICFWSEKLLCVESRLETPSIIR